ncbi:hypothetical protein PHISCL_03514 [Aspergillus sclerotialis]|uniref:Uncharacterized protein n=1 Tax=Aspergillus sclerotialis TaxID=2070753 RepID=A0A3A2ZNF0_9EURO|nr:hypothetical protein PHISCL_03514 [Aspergillus sclerotialis]
MLGHHVAQDTRSRSRLDPALDDPTEVFYKRKQTQNKTQQERDKGNNKPKPHPIPKPKRDPRGSDFSTVLSSPSDFLSAARSMLQTRAPSDTPSRPVQDFGGQPSHTTRPGDLATLKQEVPKPSPTHELLPASASRAKPDASAHNQNPTPTPINAADKGGLPIPRSTRPSLRSSTESMKIGFPTYALESPSKRTATPKPQASRVQDLTPIKRGNANADLLVDVTASTPSTDESLAKRLNKMTLSPAIEELQGLVFEQDIPSNTSSQGATSLLSGPSHPRRKIDFEQYVIDNKGKARQDTDLGTPQSHEVAPSSHDVLEGNIHADENEMGPKDMGHETQKEILPPPGLTPPKHKVDFKQYLTEKEEVETQSLSVQAPSIAPSNPQVESYRGELAELKEFIKSKSPDSFTVRSVKSMIQELEAKIHDALHESSNIASTNLKENSGQEAVDDSQIATPTKRSSKAPMEIHGEKSDAKEAEHFVDSIVKEQNQRGARREGSPTPKSPSSLRAAVTAAPFVPGRGPSLAHYRSPPESIASDSTSFHQSTSVSDRVFSTTRHDISSSSHIIGDHLLPGQCERQTSGSKPASVHSDDTAQRKLSFKIPTKASTVLHTSATTLKKFDSDAISPSTSNETPKLVSPSSAPSVLRAPTNVRVIGPGPGPIEQLRALKVESGNTPTQESVSARTKTQGATVATSAKTVPSYTQQSKYAPSNTGDATVKSVRNVSSTLQQSRYAPSNSDDSATGKSARIVSTSLYESKYAPENYKLFK